MNETTYPQGFWEVLDKRFTNKYNAMVYSTMVNSPVRYKFFNSVWENFDRNKLGQNSLNELYKQRAIMLREKYDYLILYFSGGADSYNVLRTFIDNNIKLDEVCVKWCTKVLDPEKNLYTPNTDDTSAYNYLSEWDYAIKPVLDSLKETNPDIKIQVVNWYDNRMITDPTALFRSVNHWHDIELPSLASWSPSETEMIGLGKTVGSIYGVDKPMVYFTDTQAMMYFNDSIVAMGHPNPINPTGVEFFYWSPEMPILAFEMAYQMVNVFLNDPEFKDIKFKSMGNNADAQALYQIQQKKLRHKLYSNWTDLFQTLKPEIPDRSDKHSWLFKDPESNSYIDAYYKTMHEHISKLHPRLYKIEGRKAMYHVVGTRGFVITDLK